MLGSRLGGLVPLFLRHLFVLRGSVIGAAGALLRRAFATERCIPCEIAGRLLAAAEKLVEKSHMPSGVRVTVAEVSARSTKNARADAP